MKIKIITLLSDFGSFYPAQMKGVILGRLQDKAIDVTFVDIAHDIPPQDVRAGAFALLSTVRYFPKGTIHIAVVDPGVGTERLGLVWRAAGIFFVGPDNGLLLPAARSLGTPTGLQDRSSVCGLQHLPRPGCVRACRGPPGRRPEPGQPRPEGPA